MANTKVEEAAGKAEYPLFIPFVMAGDPDSKTTVEIALQLQHAGAHILELGIPYSDPLADGPVLQRSASRALAEGMSLQHALNLVPEMRERGVSIPIVIFTYVNPVMRMGEEFFMDQVKEKGADGVLIPDLPYEESRDINKQAGERGLAYISLVAPTSGERTEKISRDAEGFLYCVSSLGVTGTRTSFPPEAYKFIEKVKAASTVPTAAGFGISTKEQVEKLRGVCDGVIVGSAIMKKVEDNLEKLAQSKKRQDALQDIKIFVSSLISS